MSFETIEHLPDAAGFLARLSQTLKSSGTLICSVPNQERMPYNPQWHPYHVRHYTPSELDQLLVQAGFDVRSRHNQPDGASERIDDGWHGQYSIAVCRRQIACSARGAPMALSTR